MTFSACPCSLLYSDCAEVAPLRYEKFDLPAAMAGHAH